MNKRRSRRFERRFLVGPVVGVIAACLLAACGGATGDATITLYNGQHPQLTQALVSAFSKQTGITVRVRTDDGIVLADQLLSEGSSSPADVYLTENSPELMFLAEHHLLAKLPSSTTDQIAAEHNSPNGNWVGVALRVSVLAYDPSAVSPARLPTTLLDLAQPKWKGKVAVAPTDSDFVPLVGAVIATHGVSAARSWLEGLKANAAVYQDDQAVVAAVEHGQAEVGIVNQYYWYRLRLEVGPQNVHSRLYVFPNRDVGSVENVSGAAVLASSSHKSDAEKFVAFLVSEQAQRILAGSDDYEYPARPGVAANPALPPLAGIEAATVGVGQLGDDQQAAMLIQQSGLT
jgi:iron(III) transport system substrate-binding protein